MKEINNSDIGLIIGFYDDKNILQIASIYEVMNDYIVTDLNERVAKKDIIDVGFVDLNKYEQLQARIKDFESRIDFCMTMDKQNQSIIEQAETRIKELEAELKQVVDYLMLVTKDKNDEVQRAFEFEQIIKELESDKHINEIKSKCIADYLENDLLKYANLYDANHAVSVDHIEYSINKLRNNNEKND